jgi:large subunit ribosomal protein L24
MSRTKLKIRRDDTVIVLAGKDRGKTGRVLKVDPAKNRVLVEGVNVVKRRVKATADRAGGIDQREALIHVSNVSLWNPASGQRMKAGYRFLDDGTKVRFDRRTGDLIDNP